MFTKAITNMRYVLYSKSLKRNNCDIARPSPRIPLFRKNIELFSEIISIKRQLIINKNGRLEKFIFNLFLH